MDLSTIEVKSIIQKPSSSDTSLTRQNEVYDTLAINVRGWVDIFYGREWPAIQITLLSCEETFIQKMSSMFLEFIAIYSELMLKHNKFSVKNDISYEHVVCRELNYFYKAIVHTAFIEPDSAQCKLARVILNGDRLDETNPLPAYVRDQSIIFADASRMKLKVKKQAFNFAIDTPTPFIFNMALKEGLKRVFCALEATKSMKSYMNVHGFYLGDKLFPISQSIKALHAGNKQILATGEAIKSFDFKKNVCAFLIEEKASFSDTVM